ncbi:phosphotransferase, partial [Nocardia gipuzkoensis]
MEIGQGWDSVATLVDAWVYRRPRRSQIAEQLGRETRLLPWLAPLLPLPVPIPEPVEGDPVAVRHRMIPGTAVIEPTAAHGMAFGAFLRALHDGPVDEAQRHGLPPAARTLADRTEAVRQFREHVIPLLPREIHPAAR